jgi:hypothetical protein
MKLTGRKPMEHAHLKNRILLAIALVIMTATITVTSTLG